MSVTTVGAVDLGGAEAPPTAEAALAELQALRQRAEALYKREYSSVVSYVRDIDVHRSRTVVGRTQSKERDNADDPTDHMTCSCFAAAHLALIPSQVAARNATLDRSRQFVGSDSPEVLRTIIDDFQGLYTKRRRGAAGGRRSNKDSGDLPNAYSTPLHLCGYVAALTHGYDVVPAGLVDLGFEVMTGISNWLSARNGFAPEENLGPAAGVSALQARSDGSTRAYLTYWCVRSIVTWLDFVESRKLTSDNSRGSVRADRQEQVDEALKTLDLCLEAHLSYLCRILVAHFAGIGTTFDADDIVCMTAAVAIASRRRGHRDEFVAATLPLAIDVLLERNVHRDGSYVPNAPILESKDGPVTASTEELNAILLHAVAEDLNVAQAIAIGKGLAHADRKSTGPRGWGKQAVGSPDRRSAFVASGALAFLLTYYAALDRLIARYCATELGVQDPPDNHWDYLSAQATTVVEDLAAALADPGSRRSLATTSVVLGGPRSAPKERIATRIAQTLKWPILTIDPVSFLGDENSGLDQEIRRNLGYLAELSDTVVYFDAVDDWLRSRPQSAARRLLSWSMLARLDQLTASGRILLVVACENPKALQLDRPRAGRLDRVVMLEPLTDEDRVALIDQLFDHYGADNALRRAFDQNDVVAKTDQLSEGHLREMVRTAVLRTQSSSTGSSKTTSNMVAELITSFGDSKGVGQHG